MLIAYIDESYNKYTFCVGGWLCSEEKWGDIERKWARRISFENEISRKKRLKTISRFHASDCATFGGDFRGWDQARQVRLMKKLTDIIGESKPLGVAVAAGLGDFVSGYPGKQEERHRGCYFFCMMAVLLLIGDWVEKRLPGEKVAVVYDRGRLSEWAAQKAFSCAKNDKGWEARRYFTGIYPKDSKQCTLLQTADLLAYEGYKAVDRRRIGNQELRRSLEKIVGHEVPIQVQCYQPDAFQKLARMQQIVNEAQVNPSVDLKMVMDLVTRNWKRDRLRP